MKRNEEALTKILTPERLRSLAELIEKHDAVMSSESVADNRERAAAMSIEEKMAQMLRNSLGKDYPYDPPFRAAARKWQSIFRQKVLGLDLYDRGYGNYLTEKDAREYRNFCPEFLPVIKAELGTAYKAPLWANMLRSEHIPINIFVPMRSDLLAAKKVFNKLFGTERIEEVTAILIEHKPKKETHLNDNTAFDAYLSYLTPEGKRGGIGIEVKYTEEAYPLKKGSKEERDTVGREGKRYIEVTNTCGYYHDDSWDNLITDDFRQIWRNHILGASMVQVFDEEHIDEFTSVHLYPSWNSHFTHTLPEYRALLTEKGNSTFLDLTYERLFSLMDEFYIGEREAKWISYLKERYISPEIQELIKDYQETSLRQD